MAAKGKRTVSRKALDQIAENLAKLPEKKSSELSYREAVFEQSETLLAALKRGYSYEDLAAVFSNGGIKISTSTLKRYLREARKNTASQNKTTATERHLPKQTPAQPDIEPAEKPADTAKRFPKKFGKSRLQSEENPDRYPSNYGRPLEMKTDL